MEFVIRRYFSLVLLFYFIFSFSALAEVDPIEEIAAEITREVNFPSIGIKGRPLPLIGHWNTGERTGGFNPEYQLKLIAEGHHILPWFHLPAPNQKWNLNYYKSLHLCKKYNLPISFVSTQWEYLLSQGGYKKLPKEENPNFVTLLGEVKEKVSPFGSLDSWRSVGQSWTNNNVVEYLQDIYPHPPSVLFVSNNEHAKLKWYEVINSKRYVENYGILNSIAEIKKIVGDNWILLYKELIEGMKDGLDNSHWRSVSKFIGYDAFLSSAFARWPGWIKYSLYIPGRIEPWPSAWDGASVSYYTHNWNDSTDFRVMSPQIQSMNLVFALEQILEEKPSYWFELSVWDGYKPGHVKDKRSFYESIGQPYNTERYAGYVKFGMWLLRPRVVREFREWTETVQNSEAYFLKLAGAVNSLYENPILERFWRFGELVENIESKHPYQVLVPSELSDEPRWYLLSSTINHPRPWDLNTPINVYSMALSISDSGNKEWLIYNYSPLRDYHNIKVVLPGYGEVTVDASIGGEFYYVNSIDRKIEKVIVR